MKVSIIGTGYVGLTTGAALAFIGHTVTCVDIDQAKVERLTRGEVPFFEPWLPELLALSRGRLSFSTAYDSVKDSRVVFIAVGTPSRQDGAPDMIYVRGAAEAAGRSIGDGFTVIVNKSTVPIGSGNWVASLIEDTHGEGAAGDYAVASSPEFLREGSAVYDTLYSDRIVVGADDERAIDVLHELYRPIIEQSFTPPAFLPRPVTVDVVPFLTTDLASAELIKYAANSFLALKISFINEIAQLAETVGADVTQIAKGIGLDTRIGTRFLQAGLGWGGSCFAKDTSALISTAQEYGLSMPIVSAARVVNSEQRGRVVEKLLHELKILKGRTITLLGLAFKPHTDDLRDAPALDIARRLTERGAKVRAHDPVALEKARPLLPGEGILLCDDAVEACRNADAIVLVTDWPQYLELPWEEIAKHVKSPCLIDGRNILNRDRLTAAGFHYTGFGR